MNPAPEVASVGWSEFLRSQAAVACDFAIIDPVSLRRFYLLFFILFFIDIPTRTVYFGGVTEHPTGAWTTQAARNVFLRHGDQLADAKALVRDRGSQRCVGGASTTLNRRRKTRWISVSAAA